MSEQFILNNDSFFVIPEVSGGVYTSQQLEVIQRLVQNDAAVIKITEDQRIGLFVSEECYADCKAKLEKAGMTVRHYQKGLHQPVSCVGALCPFHLQDALEDCKNITKAIEGLSTPSPVRIGINGCAKSCVPSHSLDISIIGDESGYKINLGGKNTQIPELASFAADSVPASEIPALIQNVLNTYAELAQDEEGVKDVIDRVGMAPFAKVLAPYSQDAASFGEEEMPAADMSADEGSIEIQEDIPIETEEENFGSVSPMDHLESDQNVSMQDHDINPQDFTSDQDESLIPEESEEDLLAEENQENETLLEEESSIVIEEEMEEKTENENLIQDDDHIDHLQEEAPAEELEMTSESEIPPEEDLLQEDIPVQEDDSQVQMEEIAEYSDIEQSEEIEDEAEEDHIEKQLAADIDETGSLGNDDSWSQRQQMIATAQDSIDLTDDQPESVTYADEENVEIEDTSEYLDLVKNEEDETPLLEKIKDDSMESQTNSAKKKSILSPISTPQTTNSWGVESFNLNENESVIVTFTNGAEAEIEADQIIHGQKDYKICGQLIHIDATHSSLRIEAGGLKLTLPRKKAS